MKTQPRQRALLILLGALLLAAAWRYIRISGLGSDGEAAKPAATTVLAHPPGSGKVQHGNQIAMLDLARLDAAPPPSIAGRDPWRFLDPPIRKSLPERAATPPAREPAPAATTPPYAQPPELTLEYLGSFGPRDRKIAVLSDGGRTFNALEGEVIDGRFIVERIGYESVEIRRTASPDEPAKRLGLRRR